MLYLAILLYILTQQKSTALYKVYNYAKQIAESGTTLGNTVGCPLGTASAGTATTAARSDHVHPLPTCVACATKALCAGMVCYSSAGACICQYNDGAESIICARALSADYVLLSRPADSKGAIAAHYVGAIVGKSWTKLFQGSIYGGLIKSCSYKVPAVTVW